MASPHRSGSYWVTGTFVINRVINSGINSAQHYVVLGGTFDPVHQGHLITAQALAEIMGYEQVYLMPCGDAYHKVGTSSAQHRLAMLRLALAEQPILKLDARETQRQGATYTVETLAALRHELGDYAHIVWVVGTDAAVGLDQWHHWRQVFALANVLVVARAGAADASLAHWPAQKLNDKTDFKARPCGAYLQLTLPQLELSSSQVRASIKQHEVVDNHVPQPVIEYIERHGLYRG